ncbi:hypothetical protein EGW08_020698 [Elysia chlorotica]|uniref:Uncharacterized protein n=1 Tax=Elysia chlorotica TaxID=188477 RepID=A0A433SQN4_ELYCH|nr:hypothetical protein EGW08_020698 [Elysia chlorotica]
MSMYRRAVRQRSKKKRPLSVASLDERSRQSLLSQLVDMSNIGPPANTAASEAAQGGACSVLRRSTSDIPAVSWGAIYRSKSDSGAASRVARGSNSVAFSSDLEMVSCTIGELARQRASVVNVVAKAQDTVGVPLVNVVTPEGQSRHCTSESDGRYGQRNKGASNKLPATFPDVQSPPGREALVGNSVQQRNSTLSRSFSNGHSLSLMERSLDLESNRSASHSDHDINAGPCNGGDGALQTRRLYSGGHSNIQKRHSTGEAAISEYVDRQSSSGCSLTSSCPDRQLVSVGDKQYSSNRLGVDGKANHTVAYYKTSLSGQVANGIQAALNFNSQSRRNDITLKLKVHGDTPSLQFVMAALLEFATITVRIRMSLTDREGTP